MSPVAVFSIAGYTSVKINGQKKYGRFVGVIRNH
jgi:hypothetical protein